MGSAAQSIDTIWVLICTILVILMQAGFTCLESGLVRAKNSINVAVKNVMDFCVAGLGFWLVGFGLMFGFSIGGFFGSTNFAFNGPSAGASPELAWVMVFFFFQLAFCSTSTTIVAGAVAERMNFHGYLITAAVLSMLIYPVFGHWAWGGVLSGEAAGWLELKGFIDFAGSTVVHSIGGWIALAAILVIGPRIGRFGPGGRRIEPHDMPMATLGMFLLWIGWFGFNGGSTLALNTSVPYILVHTMLAAAAGGVAVMGLSWARSGLPDVQHTLNGILAGLVAITANCHIVDMNTAVLIGIGGGIVCFLASELLERLHIDDAVDAVPVHLAAGIWGTLAVALFGDVSLFPNGHSRFDQFLVQAQGVLAAGVFAFGVAFVVLTIVNRFLSLRVSADAERIGLNVVEHGASSALLDVLGAMEAQASRGDFSKPVHVEPFTEAGEMATRYNLVLDKFNSEVRKREQTANDLRDARDVAELANASKSQFLANMSHELRTPLNAIIGFSEVMNGELFGPIENERYKDYVGDIHKSSSHLLSLINDILDLSKIEADRYELYEEELDVMDVVASCERMMRHRADEAGVALKVTVEDELPLLMADKRALRQIVLNLVSNAVKFTPKGGLIQLGAFMEPDGRMAFRVADTGVGMSKKDIPIALEPFRQIGKDSNVYSTEGTGLGLPLTRALARLHGASLVIESEPGEGTTITIRMPYSRVLQTAVRRIA
ncbi:integral membrane sensor signal transduction histidine kinase [Parvibaculum lavamentivorans DS-1]|uniref:Ammonium transporter n=1 Tax=Parvibaculum lavamentivorans (strain DS-1 / DSM 13023 / NCIMB 13966) TaxID=402881 RepID=A7HT14_PARL1|nr:ammonium transporter [Parvibaculum lavamentivorans]ABS63047.1 integral membrane sensor signal transduction histidine kinase [Parvibaculum lavamentivorans DS-1]